MNLAAVASLSIATVLLSACTLTTVPPAPILADNTATDPSPTILTMTTGPTPITIHCPGGTSTWNQCYEKAEQACQKNYDVIKKESFMIDKDTIVRNLQVECK